MDGLDRIQYFEDLKGNFSITYSDTDRVPRKNFHIHNAYELFLNLSENVLLDVNEESYVLPPNSLLLFNTMDLHRVRLSGNNRYKRYVLWFKDDFLNPLGAYKEELLQCFYIRGFDKANFLPLMPEKLQEIIALYKKIQHVWKKSNNHRQDILLRFLLGELLVHINELYHRCYLTRGPLAAMENYQVVYHVIQYIRSHLSEDLSQNQLSKIAYLDKRRLCKNFQEITGFTTGQYILNCRLTAAKALLIQGESVLMTCEKTGFGDSSNFSRTFHKHVGLSPKQYAIKYRNHVSWEKPHEKCFIS